MANYEASIKLAVLGAKDLDRVTKKTELLAKNIDFINNKAQKGTAGTPVVKNFKNLSKAVTDANDALNEAAIGTKEFNQAVKNVVQVENQFEKLQKQKIRRFKIERLAQQEGISFSKAKILLTNQEAEAEAKLAAAKQRTAAAERLKRRNRIISSAAIGGGFPLLFGGGPVSAIGGAIGGGIGESIRPGGGFAGSIAVTAAIGQIQEFVNASREVGNALKDANLGLEKLEQLGFDVDDVTKKQVENLLELGRVREAENLVNKEFAEIIGPQAVKNLQNLDTAFDELDQAISKLFLKLSSELAPTFTLIIDFTTKLVNLLSALPLKELLSIINPTVRAIDLAGSLNKPKSDNNIDLSTGMTDLGGGKGSSNKKSDFSKFELNILNQRIGLQKINNDLLDTEFVRKKRGLIEAETALDIARAEGNENRIAIANKNRILKLNDLDLAITKAKLKDEKDLAKFLEDQRKKLEKLEKKEKEIAEREIERVNKLKESTNSVTKNLEQQHELNLIKLSGSEYELALANATLGLSKEQLALFDEEAFKIAFNNKLRSDGLLEQKQITQEIKTLLATEMSSAIKGLITGTHNLNSALSSVLNKMADAMLNMGLFGNVGGSLTKGGGLLGTIFGGLLHAGGPAKGGSSYIVGEKGPELFTPGVSGMVTPNSALGGSNNIVVNVDASGTQAEGDDSSSNQLGKLIGLAVQQELVKQQRAGGLLSRA